MELPLKILGLLLLLKVHHTATQEPSSEIVINQLVIERTRAISLLFSCLNCLSESDGPTEKIREVNRHFSPSQNLNEYVNPAEVELLLIHVQANQAKLPGLVTEPFTFTPESTEEILTITRALLPNTGNWALFYNTAVWLLGRVNSARLYFALNVIIGEKLQLFVVTPSSVEVFPQMFIDKLDIASIAGITVPDSEKELLNYFISDPWLNEFHWNWHVDNPFFWDQTIFPNRDRQGELFFFMHHQLLSRYNAERASNGLPYVSRLGLELDYVIPEAYDPDIINVNYVPYPSREEGTTMAYYDNGTILADMRTWLANMEEGISQGYFLTPEGLQVSLKFENASDILGYTVGAVVPSPNLELYGDLNDNLYKFIAGLDKPGGPGSSPGVEASTSTTLIDPVFFQLQKTVDQLYMDLKSRNYQPYSESDLHYPNFQIDSVVIRREIDDGDFMDPPHILSTYFDNFTFDIGTAARPCRGMGGDPAFTQVKVLQHDTFSYYISVQSSKPTKAYGMVRIWLLPQYGFDGTPLGRDESHQNAIQLDMFPVVLDPWEYRTIVRSSRGSSVTRAPLPGIKALYNFNPSSGKYFELLNDGNKRACGFPNNLLIPKGTAEGMQYKLFVMISEEPEAPIHLPFPWRIGNDFEHYPYCGLLGLNYPDQRSMGYPFDRPGTLFTSGDEYSSYGNVRQVPIIITHRD